MKKKLFFAAAALTAASALSAAPATLQAVRVEGKINVDGKLSEKAWAKATTVNKFYVNGLKKPAYPTTAKLLYDDNAVYIGFDCPTPPGGTIKATAKKRSDRVYYDDCVEVMIDPNKTGDRYFHILVNSLGAINDRYCDQGGYVGDDKWNGVIKARAAKTGNGYSVEIRVPYYTLDIIPGGSKDWGFNFCRDTRNPNQESSAANGHFNVAGMFLKVQGMDIPLAKYGWETSPPAVSVKRSGKKLKVDLSVSVSNLAAQAQDALVDFVILGDNGSATAVTPRKFKSEESIKVVSRGLELGGPGKYRCIVSISDPVTKKIYKRRTYPLSVDFSPVEITLLDPHYRDAIFATQNLKNVVYTVKSNLPAPQTGAFITGIKTSDGKVLVSKKMLKPGKVTFPADKLPEGKMQIFVRALDKKGKLVGENTHALRKLPYQKGEVWLDKERFWRVDGKRYFVMSEWNDLHVKGIPIGVGEKAFEKGGKFITGNLMWSSFPARNAYKLPSIPAKEEAIIRKTVRKYRNDPAMFAYYLSDEPEISGISAAGLTDAARIIRDEDPYHPIVISNNSVVGGKDYADAAEINGLHPYPNPAKNQHKSNFSKVVTFMDQAIEFNRNRRHPQTITFLQQGFNYGDWGAADSRIPTYDEIRTQFLMTLIMGGRGILTYNRLTSHYPELYIGMPYFVKEMQYLAPAFLADDVVSKNIKVSNPAVRYVVKKLNNDYFVMAVSTNHNKEKAAFTVPEIGNRKLYVVSENRTVNAKGGKFSDLFDNYQVHIYTTNANAAKLTPVARIEAEIAQVNNARRKPGNKAFQMFEHDHVQISASSNAGMNRRADCGLWHVTDGVIVDYKNSNIKYTVWHDKTPNQAPDWIELKFDKVISMSKVKVCAYENSLRDFEVQIFQGGKFVTVASVKGSDKHWNECSFPAVKSDRVRIFVTATNGPTCKIDEIEVY